MTDLGLRQNRLEGEEYLAIVDEFMEAVHARWPKAIVQVLLFLNICFKDILVKYTTYNVLLEPSLQFEDFQMKWAFETLERYRKRFCMFNDDVQVNCPNPYR